MSTHIIVANILINLTIVTLLLTSIKRRLSLDLSVPLSIFLVYCLLKLKVCPTYMIVAFRYYARVNFSKSYLLFNNCTSLLKYIANPLLSRKAFSLLINQPTDKFIVLVTYKNNRKG